MSVLTSGSHKQGVYEMSDIQINQLLQQMRSMAQMAEGPASLQSGVAGVEKAAGPDFGKLLTESIDKVNETQKSAAAQSTAFSSGDPNVNLSDVMVAIQKANVSFQAMTQVRNNLVSAYKEVMNMQV